MLGTGRLEIEALILVLLTVLRARVTIIELNGESRIHTLCCFSEEASVVARAIQSSRDEMAKRPIRPVAEEVQATGRRALDSIFPTNLA